MISFTASASSMKNDIELARASNMEEDKASSPNIEMATYILQKLDNELRWMPIQRNGSEFHRSDRCIYRVPNQLRNVNSKAYDPNLISIGPLHRENKGLEAMEKEKLKYFRKLTEQYGMDEKKMCDIVISIKNQEDRLRNCYSEKSILMESSDDFVKMILLDAVFIIQFVLESNDDNGPKNFNPRMTLDIREDLVLLENQLPLFIIQEIYDQVSYHSSVIEPRSPRSFLDLATCYLREYLHSQVVETRVERSGHIRNLMLCKTSPDVEKEKETSPDVEKEKESSPDVEKEKESSPDVEIEIESSPDVEIEIESSPDVEKEIESSPDVEIEIESSPDVEIEIKTSPDVEKETSAGVMKKPRHLTDLLRNLMLCKTSQGVETENSSDVETKFSSDVETEFSPYVKKEPRHLIRNLMLCKTSQGVETETSSDVETEFSPYVKKEPRHLTDLLRNLMLSRAIQRSYSPDLVKLKYSAIMLRKAGVRFQVTRDKCLVNIKFDNGVLKIPHLKVDHNLERLVRNIMALEQCCYSSKAYICSYIKFMHHLIHSAEDVGLLVENGIILHCLGDDAEVSNMINNFCENIGDNDTCFGDISKELNAHYENRSNHRKATLKLVYFPTIWRGTATVAAAILLILTFIQAVCSVISLL